jgi:GDP-L-fucose synthase
MSVLVAGSTGLAGSAIAAAFESQGREVIKVHRGVLDLMDLDSTRNFLKASKPTLVVDAAAKVGGIGANNSFPVEFLVDNIRIQSNLMQAAHEAKVENLVFLGSSCIYPRNCLQPIKEEYLLTGPLEESNSAYAIAKIAGIELVNSYRKEYGTRWISLMPTNLYREIRLLYAPQCRYRGGYSH